MRFYMNSLIIFGLHAHFVMEKSLFPTSYLFHIPSAAQMSMFPLNWKLCQPAYVIFHHHHHHQISSHTRKIQFLSRILASFLPLLTSFSSISKARLWSNACHNWEDFFIQLKIASLVCCLASNFIKYLTGNLGKSAFDEMRIHYSRYVDFDSKNVANHDLRFSDVREYILR